MQSAPMTHLSTRTVPERTAGIYVSMNAYSCAAFEIAMIKLVADDTHSGMIQMDKVKYESLSLRELMTRCCA